MDRATFQQLMEANNRVILALNQTKGADYSGDDDALANFKRQSNVLSWEQNPELCWAAGFYDGEGCASVMKGKKRGDTPRMKVAQVELATLDRFVTAIGIGKIMGPYEQPGKRNAIYSWSVSGPLKVYEVAERLWPWLGEVKRDQIIRVMETARASRRSRPGDGRARAFPKIVRLGIPSLTPEQVWATYVNKHWDAVMTYVREGAVQSEPIEGRLLDLILYCHLFLGLVAEGNEKLAREREGES